jgi:hypothetical protein
VAREEIGSAALEGDDGAAAGRCLHRDEFRCRFVPGICLLTVGPTSTRVVTPVLRSCRNRSLTRLVSPGTSVLAVDMKATYRPFGLNPELTLFALPWAPWVLTLTR